MITNLTTSTVYSILGNNSSLVPLAMKDIANSCGLTAASYMSGDKAEGKDRFIDEFGTQAIWLWGIPAYKKAIDLTLFKFAGLDAKVDARILKDANILNAAIEAAPTEQIKNSLKNVANHQSKFKAFAMTKFALSTALTALTYLGLTKFRHNYTENQIKKDILNKQQAQKDSFIKKSSQEVPFASAFADVHGINKKGVAPAFTGGMQDFIFDPVKNLMIVDGIITGERLSHSKNPQDFFGYVIKEGSFWAFMYLAGPLIAKALEKSADKKGKSIDLDARVIFNEQLKNSFKDGSIKAHLAEFKAADISDVAAYKFAVKPQNKNLVVEFAKQSDIIELLKDSDKVDTRRFINLDDLRGVAGKLEKLFGQYEASGESLDEFFKSVQKLKKGAIWKNIGSCIGALGILAPAIMLLTRKFGSGSEYQVRKDLEKKMNANSN